MEGGALNMVKESWKEGPGLRINEVQCKSQQDLKFRAKLHTPRQLSRENLLKAQEQQLLYIRGTRLREFAAGDKVLV